MTRLGVTTQLCQRYHMFRYVAKCKKRKKNHVNYKLTAKTYDLDINFITVL
jgi:hypothetical protein